MKKTILYDKNKDSIVDALDAVKDEIMKKIVGYKKSNFKITVETYEVKKDV